MNEKNKNWLQVELKKYWETLIINPLTFMWNNHRMWQLQVLVYITGGVGGKLEQV